MYQKNDKTENASNLPNLAPANVESSTQPYYNSSSDSVSHQKNLIALTNVRLDGITWHQTRHQNQWHQTRSHHGRRYRAEVTQGR